MFFSIFKKKKKSGPVAKQRLQNILISDRADCSSDLIEAIKEDLCASVTKYMDVDFKQIHLDITCVNSDDLNPSQYFLTAKIPFRGINKVIC